MASAKKKKPGRKVHIDNLHLVKKLEPAYTEAFFDFEEVLLREPIEDEKINIIANIAIEQLQEGMAKKKKPSHHQQGKTLSDVHHKDEQRAGLLSDAGEAAASEL